MVSRNGSGVGRRSKMSVFRGSDNHERLKSGELLTAQSGTVSLFYPKGAGRADARRPSADATLPGQVVCPRQEHLERGGQKRSSRIRNDNYLRHSRGASMTRISLRRLATLVSFLAVAGPAAAAEAQGYFGRNKVQYETFDWRILKSEHFDNFFYPAESVLARDAARMAERWYTRHSDTFRHAFDRKSLIFYADQPDWQQTNVVNESFDEGTGGVTEPLHTRVVLPFTGVNFNNDHVIGHELVHVFQYNIAEGNGRLQRLDVLPLWLIEGMAEYFSLDQPKGQHVQALQPPIAFGDVVLEHVHQLV